MGFVDWLFDTVESAGKSIADVVEDTGRNIARRGDAFFGVEEYEDADVSDRVEGFLGFHSDGTFKKQKEKKNAGLEKGDIVGVSRSFYDHYGVYVGEDSVIHYTGESSDMADGRILKTSFSRFLRDADEYFILVFPDKYGEPSKVHFEANIASLLLPPVLEWFKKNDYKLYGNEETVKRAYSRLGENRYDLLSNNCEHFAIWCKTGLSESHQIKSLLNALAGCTMKMSGPA